MLPYGNSHAYTIVKCGEFRLCHDTGEIPHTLLSYMRVNFHREASLTLFYFFFGFPVEYLDLSCRFCYNLFWIVMPKTK